MAGLCRAYQASQGRVGHELDRAVLAELASLAGGVEEVPEFCALLLGELDKGNDPGRGSPPVEASRGPSESRGPGVAGEEAP